MRLNEMWVIYKLVIIFRYAFLCTCPTHVLAACPGGNLLYYIETSPLVTFSGILDVATSK